MANYTRLGGQNAEKKLCSDMTFDATVNPVVYEGGISVFIDTERDTWNMDPVALEKVFEIYPYVKVIVAHLYGIPGKIAENVRKWSTKSREAAPWCQHEELGYNYRMGNVIVAVIRG